MKKSLQIVVVVSALLLSWKGQAQEKILIDTTAAAALSKDVTQMVFEDKAEQAFQLLSLYWPYNPQDIMELSEKFISESEVVPQKFGPLLDFQKGPVYSLSNFRIKYIYYLRYQYFALRLIFEYQLADSGWILGSFKYSDDLSEDYQKISG